MHLLFSSTNTRLLPFIHDVLDEWIYEGSPICTDCAEGIDRETLHVMTDKVMDNICIYMDEADEICVDEERGHFSRHGLLRSNIEALLVCVIIMHDLTVQSMIDTHPIQVF